MSFAGCRVGESLVAVPTAERLLSSVDTHVSLEITRVGEFLPTVLKKEERAMEKQPRCKTTQLNPGEMSKGCLKPGKASEITEGRKLLQIKTHTQDRA